jgi:hypothetical protein
MFSKPGTVVHTNNPSTQEVEAEVLQVQGQSGQHNEFQASLRFIMKHYVKKFKSLKMSTAMLRTSENMCEADF